jgi:signal transduction histidine kinase
VATPAGAGSGNSTSTTREKAVKFAECMRVNGVSRFPDPNTSGELSIDGVADGSAVDTSSAAFEQALSACKELEPPGFTGTKVTPQQTTARLKFAQCVRDSGVPDFPDPTPDGPLVETKSNPIRGDGGRHEHSQRRDAEVQPVRLSSRLYSGAGDAERRNGRPGRRRSRRWRRGRHVGCRASDRGADLRAGPAPRTQGQECRLHSQPRQRLTRPRRVNEEPLKRRLANDVATNTNGGHARSASFAAYIAHELRTALATQRALLELALTDPDADIAAWHEVGHDVLAACKQQERVLRACITLSRNEAEPGRCETLDLAAIIAELLQSTDLHGHTATVSLEPAPTTGDPVLIERLLDSLLANAVRHNDARGWIAITASTKARRAVVSFENTGTPIPADELSRLFEPFEQVHPPGAHAGLGLGLAVVKAIADAHGAHISAHPRSGGGLRLEVAFPLETAPRDGAALSRLRKTDHTLPPPAKRGLNAPGERDSFGSLAAAEDLLDDRPA